VRNQLRLVAGAYDSRPRSRLAYDVIRRARDADPVPGLQRNVAREQDGDWGRDRRRARDQEEDGGIDQVKAFIQANMDPAAFAKLEQMLEALNGGGGEEESPADDPRQEAADPPPNGAQDDPENFKGEPLKGGKMAGDARPRGSYFDSFPGNRRVYVLDYGSGR
jgi:hypothetical protein